MTACKAFSAFCHSVIFSHALYICFSSSILSSYPLRIFLHFFSVSFFIRTKSYLALFSTLESPCFCLKIILLDLRHAFGVFFSSVEWISIAVFILKLHVHDPFSQYWYYARAVREIPAVQQVLFGELILGPEVQTQVSGLGRLYEEESWQFENSGNRLILY